MSAAARRHGPYAPLSATYADDDAVIEAGEAAELLFVRGLAFLATSNSDGYITKAQLIRSVGAGMRDAVERADKLVEVGLWTSVDGGYTCRSWLKWNRSADELGREKKKDRERKAALTTEVRNAVHDRDGWHCLYCLRLEDLCIDHVTPLARGGTHDTSNLQTLCQSCNFRKGTRDLAGMSLEEVRALLKIEVTGPQSTPPTGRAPNSSDRSSDFPVSPPTGPPRESSDVPVSRASTRPPTRGGAQTHHITSLQDTPLQSTAEHPRASAREAAAATDPERDRPMALAGTTNELVAEYANSFSHALPRKTRADLHRHVDDLLGQGFTREQVRDGLVLLHQRPHLGPGTLSSLVHEALSAPATVNKRAGRSRPMSNVENGNEIMAQARAARKTRTGDESSDHHQTSMMIVLDGKVEGKTA